MIKIKELKNHAGFIKYFKNTSWLFIENILRLLVGFFVGVWVARYLGPDKYGIFNYSMAFVSIFSGIANLGLDDIVIRELVKEPKKKDIYLGTAFWLKLIGAFISIILVTIAVFLLESDKITRIYILIISFGTIFQSFNVIDFHFRSMVMAKYVSICKMIQLIISCCLKIYLIITRADLIWFVSVTLFDAATLAISLNIAYRSKNKSSFYSHFDRNIALTMLKNSWPLVLSVIAVGIYMKIDQIMIKNMIDPAAVGQYSAAVKISEIWYFIPMIITSSLFPAIINAKKKSEELYYARLQKLYNLMVWLAISIALPMTFLSDWVIKLIYGSAYSQAGSVLMIHIWAGVFVSLGVASQQYLIVENYIKISLFRTFIAAIVNVILNIILIPKYGINGAAISSVFSFFLSTFLIGLIPRTSKQAGLMLKSFNLINIFCNNKG